MKKLFILVIILFAVGVGIPALHTWSEAATVAKFSQIEDMKPPMTVAQVETSVGAPSRIDSSETTGVTGQVYHYPFLRGEMKLVFVNGVVFHAEFLPGAKS